MESLAKRRMTRRAVLVGVGGAAASTLAGCGRQRQSPTTGPVLPTPTPAALTRPESAPGAPTPGPTDIPAAPLPIPTNAPSLPVARVPTPRASVAAAPTRAGPGAPTIPAAGSASPTASLAGPPDLILRNGKIITVDASDRIVASAAIRNGRFLAVGSEAEVVGSAGSATQILDLGGRTVTPGLIDPHNHLQVYGLMDTYYVAFLPPEVKSVRDLQARLSELAAKTPKTEWLKGYYLGLTEGRMPNRSDLDAAAPEHPVWLLQQGGHYGSANSAALRLAGITASTPDPVGGVIERDARGEPTGVFYNHRAMDLLRSHMPQYTLEMAQDNITTSQPVFAACGITSFQDNNVRGTDVLDTYLENGRQRKMLLRGAVYYTLEWPQDLDRALKEIRPFADDYMRFAGYKFLIDGQAQMAYTHEPHNGVRWNVSTWEPASFKRAVRALHDTGRQICVHCIGDAATDLVLDAYEEAMKANPRPDPRHRIEHCILCTPRAIARMKELGVVVSTQPQFLRLAGDYWPTVFGEERTKRAIPTREWLRAGVHLAIGSDAPTTPWYNPQMTLAGAVTRVTPTNKVLGPDQVLTIQEALRAHTMGAAYAAHEEKEKGSVEVGKLADLAVWKGDLYNSTPQQIAQAAVELTLIGGKVVYRAADSSLQPRPAR